MPENLVMTSPYSVYPYRLWGRLSGVGKGVSDIGMLHFVLAQKKKKNKTKQKTKQNKKQKKKKEKKYLEAANRVASFYAPFMLRSSFV